MAPNGYFLLTETPVLTGSYDLRLVALSVLIAICASYAALDLAGRVTAARGRALVFWLIGGAGAMGLGIWSMHYIGMLAFRLPVPVSYDWPTVMLSLRVAILASGVALYVVSRKFMSLWRAVAGSIVMGAGIAAMHYIGMEAMRSTAMCHYDTRLVALSVVLAIVISFVALRLAFLARDEKKGISLRKIASATVMGLAIPVMHYTGMAAASFTADGMVPDMSHAMSITIFGTAGITIVTLMILSLAVLTSVFDRRLSAQSLELESAEERYRLLFERSLAGVIRTTLDGRILECNLACARIFGYATCEELIASPITDRYFSPGDRDYLYRHTPESEEPHQLRAMPAAEGWEQSVAPGQRKPRRGHGRRARGERRNFCGYHRTQECGRDVSQGLQREPGTHHHRDHLGRPLHRRE